MSDAMFGSEVARHLGILIAGEKLRQAWELITRISASDKTVLILGKTGTGKEKAARAVHDLSSRAAGNFVTVDCTTLVEHLAESQVLGHERGAFTSAIASRKGFFEEADGGTIFLDEVGELPLQLQPKLLRVLENQTVTPLGSTKERRINVRVVAATNRDLREMVEKKIFREDLYWRLQCLEVQLPPLAEIPEAIPEFVSHFWKLEGGTEDRFNVSGEALFALMRYAWPGNLRQLRKVVGRGVVLSDRGITMEALPGEISAPSAESHKLVQFPAHPPKCSEEELLRLSAVVRMHVEKVLERTAGNKKAAAGILGITAKTLHAWLVQWRGEDLLNGAAKAQKIPKKL